jgi:hypothetical protein
MEVPDTSSVAESAYWPAAQRIVALLSALEYGENVGTMLDEMTRREMSMSLAVAIGYLSDMMEQAAGGLDITFGEYLRTIGLRVALGGSPPPR